ncbi:KH domain-containing protein [candidate division WS5 bacterium]|uniref:KH domain-containing protein n=1 Tax=candidate division WS5 bacterium TaxID=2093353 RepID=A0A419DGP9_9BACT|nr:MAG: KH domain-containing protein [candidate division WS5 bacterium]
MSISVSTIKKVKEKAEKTLTLLGVDQKTAVSAEEGRVRISIDSTDKALLIGYRGENLFALRYMLALICREILPEGTSLVADVGGYLKDKEKRIENMVETAAKKVRDTGMEEMLPPMNAYERMLAHQKAAKMNGITSYSEGSGNERKLFISKEQSGGNEKS